MIRLQNKPVTQKHRFQGMNLDDDLHAIDWSNEHRYGLNIRVGSSESGNLGVVENIKGTEQVSFVLPTGTNKVIGSYEDRQDSEVYYFLYNSLGTHGIYKYSIGSNSISKVFEWTGLNFSATEKITGIGKIGPILGWTDTNAPRALDLDKVATYPTPYVEDYISLIKKPPPYPPTATLTTDATYIDNNIKKKEFQFRTRLIYTDNTVSALSPISKITYNTLVVIAKGQQYGTVYDLQPGLENCISLDLNLDDIMTVSTANIVKKIEVLVREGNSGAFGIFTTLTKAQYDANPVVKFYNDKSVSTISDEESNKLFDAVPLKAKALEATKNRFFLGGVTEGFDVLPITATATPVYAEYVDTLRGSRVFKSRGIYQFGIVYYDGYGRCSGVQTSDSLRVVIDDNITAGLLEGLNANINTVCTSITINLTGTTAPSWAKYYQIVRTRDLRHNIFFPARFYQVKHLTGIDANNVAQYSDTYTDLAIETQFSFDVGTFSNVYYLYSEGDRVVFYNNSTGNIVDLPIKGIFNGSTYENSVVKLQKWTDTGEYNIVKEQQIKQITKISIERYNGFSGGFGYIYSPATNDGLFYEVGEVYPINTPGVLSTTSINVDGDVFLTMRALKFPGFGGRGGREFNVEAENLFPEKFDVHNEDIGRVNAIITDEKEEYKESSIRYSFPYIQESTINGLSTFNAEDEEILPAEYGDITKLQVASDNQSDGNVLLSIHENESVTIYIGQAIIKDNRGQELLATTDRVIGSYRALRGGWGSVNPESVTQHNGRVYGYDAKRGVVWRYSQDGLTPISFVKAKTYFHEKSRSFSGHAYGGYDPYHEEYILSFEGSDTIAWSENIGRWTTYYSFNPENYAMAGTRLIGFQDGALWLHNKSATYNNFYGTQYTSQVKTVTNTGPSNPKLFTVHSCEGDSLWRAKAFETPEGQTSELKDSNYTKLEHTWYAPIKRNTNTARVFTAPQSALNNGDPLLSRSLVSTLEFSGTTKALLYASNISFIWSKGHRV